MAHTITIPKFITKHAPSAYSGIVATSIVYVGADRVGVFVDNIFGSITQRIAIGLPIIGNFSVKDLIIYAIVSKGFRYNTPTIIGFFANKFLFGPVGLAVPKLNIPGFGLGTAIPGAGITQQPGAISVNQGAPL